MTIIQAFKAGKIAIGQKSKPKHITTVVSNVFLFKNKGYKIYRSDSEFFNKSFNDLSQKENRFEFTSSDFKINNKLSPEIYTELRGVIIKNGKIEFIKPTNKADELVIVMNKFDIHNQLINRLRNNKISMADCREIGRQLAKRLSRLPKIKPVATLYDDFILRYHDAGPWLAGAEKYIPQKLADKYRNVIRDFTESHKKEFSSKKLMGICADIHADNGVFYKGSFYPIDVYPPKERWLHAYKYFSLYRVATDIYAFLGQKAFDSVIESYEKTSRVKIPRQYDKFMVIYCELIVWPYQYMLSEKQPWRFDIAKKHEKLIAQMYSSLITSDPKKQK